MSLPFESNEDSCPLFKLSHGASVVLCQVCCIFFLYARTILEIQRSKFGIFLEHFLAIYCGYSYMYLQMLSISLQLARFIAKITFFLERLEPPLPLVYKMTSFEPALKTTTRLRTAILKSR